MKLSTRCRYGTRALIEIARNFPQGPTKRKDIAVRQQISEGYLENILSILRAARFVRTVRGAHGGFVLERDPETITLLEIVSALEGTMSPIECVENEGVCSRTPNCAARKAWHHLYQAQTQALESMTLRDLVTLENDGTEPDYQI
jgi:Rrf2 family cysteine metabolism transcriptional repressor